MHIDAVLLQVIGKGLLDVKNHAIEPGVLQNQAIQDFVHISRFLNGAVEVGGKPIDAPIGGDPTHLSETLIIPIVVIAAELHFEALQPIPLYPIGQKNGIPVIGFRAGEFGFVQKILSPNEVPGHELFRCGAYEIVFWELALKRDLGILGRFQVRGEIPIHKLSVVCIVNSAFMQNTVSVVKSDIEGRTANQSRQPGHWLGSFSPGIGLIQQVDKYVILEGMADLHRVARYSEILPGPGQLDCELFEQVMPLLPTDGAWPDPLDIDRGFAPSHGGSARRGFDSNLHSGASYVSGGLWAKLQRDSCLDGQEIECC
jgi:hypothetical protein